MKNKMNLNAFRLTNITDLTIKKGVRVDQSREMIAVSAQKLIEMVRQLQEEQYLGWQLMPGETMQLRAFASEDLSVTATDYQWIFGSWAEVSEPESDMSENSLGVAGNMDVSFPHIYELYVRETDRGKVELDRMETASLYEMLVSLGAEICFLAFGGSVPSCLVLLRMNEEMPLYLRGMISSSFQALSIRKIQGKELNPEMCLFSDDSKKVMTGFLLSHTNSKFQKKQKKTEEITDDTPITHLGLSIRAMNCLLKHGTRTVHDLKGMTEADLMNVRNIGKRCFQEVNDKMAELGIPLKKGMETALDYNKQLEVLIGLSAVKEQMKKVVAFAKMKKDMTDMHLTDVPMVLNMTFEGNPGTAKTTVARILAGLFAEQGILKSNKIMEVGRADLVGKYVGHTADQVKKIFEEAKGRLLFIDEAYSLIDDNVRSFGDEAINTIVQEIENHRDETIVIFAGYPKRMEEFLGRNPGLKSRVPFRIYFEDYDVEEMTAITELEAKKRGFTVSPEARERIRTICGQMKNLADSGNGRICRNLAENAILNYAVRKYGNGETTVNLDLLLTEEEFPLPEIAVRKPARAPIGFLAG